MDHLYTAVISDALDSLGIRDRTLNLQFRDFTGAGKLFGSCKTTLWVDMYHEDPRPYELELEAVDSCRPGEVIICAAGGSTRSGIWGELLSTAAINSGAAGVLVDGAVRDVDQMRRMDLPVFATATSPRDSLNRQRVVDIDVPVEIDGVRIDPGDYLFADLDGVVIIPGEQQYEVIRRAEEKAGSESEVRREIRNGMKASEAYRKYGVL